ncbi:ANTAR domain-containing response regulator [Beijerinckia sp. L45]|uniref:ANTAR domain-containing response regulator n=1 Tax=Beijerinckia sp. L45 TaxID=1641855 RepID=UPI001FF02DAB|nr:ANTAR domain-containing protein [Beijerinckia sp. L45]
MTPQRLIQNFKHGRGLLWAGPDFNAETLERTLSKLGVSLTRLEHVDGTALDHNRDIVFIDGDHAFDPALLMRAGAALPPAPTIGMVGVEAPSRLKLLADVGVTAFLRKPIQAAAIYAALFLGVNNHGRMRVMDQRLADHDRRHHGRRFVIKAVIALVQYHGLSDDEAYARLRRESMRQRIGLEEFCAALVADGSGTFPAEWPALHAEDGPSRHPGDKHETHDDDGRRSGGSADADRGPGRGPDQAGRA